MTLPIPRAVREFVESVRAIAGALPTLYAVRSTMDQLMREVENVDIAHMQQQLESERVAHEETKQTLETMGEQYRAAFEAETAARKEAERKLGCAWQGGFSAAVEWWNYEQRGVYVVQPSNPYTHESLAAMEKTDG
jgi:hypothetical protein